MTDTQRAKWKEEIRKPYVTGSAQSLTMAAEALVETMRHLVAKAEVRTQGPFEERFLDAIQTAEDKNGTPSVFLAAYRAYGEAQRQAVRVAVESGI
jgi:prophage DNA circulation protein